MWRWTCEEVTKAKSQPGTGHGYRRPRWMEWRCTRRADRWVYEWAHPSIGHTQRPSLRVTTKPPCCLELPSASVPRTRSITMRSSRGVSSSASSLSDRESASLFVAPSITSWSDTSLVAAELFALDASEQRGDKARPFVELGRVAGPAENGSAIVPPLSILPSRVGERERGGGVPGALASSENFRIIGSWEGGGGSTP